jgi:hypothetical protein
MAKKKKRSAPKKRKAAGSKPNKWSAKVDTDSTHPPEHLFNQDAKTIARVMATKKVSPKGLGSAIRMVQFFINRAGKQLNKKQRHELEKAKKLLQEKNQKRRQKEKPSADS